MDRFSHLDGADRALLRPAPHPAWVSPMLATLAEGGFDDPAWVFERKLDGERVMAYRHGSEVRLLSRRRRRLERTYPELVAAIAAQDVGDFVVDGEVVAFEGRRTSFACLQQRLAITDPAEARRSPVAVYYYLFDLVHVEGLDTTRLPLRARKALLRAAVRFEDPLRFTTHRNAQGVRYAAEACAMGWEGLVAKRARSRYVSRRSTDWLKVKCTSAQELVIGGFTEPGGTRIGLGALLVGYHEAGLLRYAGKVGSGYSDRMLVELRGRLDRLAANRSPFGGERIAESAVHWVRPELVAQVAFTEWTRDGKLRHPRFEGLRLDKDPTEVRRERPEVGRGA